MNAIILAAGLGSRFKDITKKTHKALLPIENIPNIERTIRFLKEANIDDIYIVTGHLSEQFQYLEEKYQCKLVHNPKYSEYNNIYSFYLVNDVFGDSYMIDSDVVLFDNIFDNDKLEDSHYFTIPRPKSENKEWIPIVGNDGKVVEMEISNREDYSLLGISFWKQSDAEIIKQKMKSEFLAGEKLENPKLYWDDIPISLLSQLNIEVIKKSLSEAYEIDNIDDYNFINNKLI